MRSAIFLSVLILSSAINEAYMGGLGDDSVKMFGAVFAVFAVADIIELFKDNK